MYLKTWIVKPSCRLGLLLLALGSPGALASAAEDLPEMSAEAKLQGELYDLDAPEEGWFKPDPSYEEAPYDAEAQLVIYGGKHMNRTADPPVELGHRLYDRGSYELRPTWL